MIYEVGVEIKVQGKRVVPVKSPTCRRAYTDCAFFREVSCPPCGRFMFVHPHEFAAYLAKQLIKEAT